MSKSKSYNRIVFLTTLSLYLGLVLVGGTAPILAHSATTKSFDVRNDIEFKDNLDKKPDDKEAVNFDSSLENYFEDSKSLIKDLQKLYQIEKFDLAYDIFELNSRTFEPCNVQCEPCSLLKEESQKIDNLWLKPAVIETSYRFENWSFLGDCLKYKHFENSLSRSSNFKSSYDKSTLSLELSAFKLSPQDAEKVSAGFTQAIPKYKPDEDEVIIKELQRNTSSRSENNQVFIVTRLPRAALNSLFAATDAH